LNISSPMCTLKAMTIRA